VREITAPDRTDRRRRGKSDDFDAEAAAHAAFAGKRALTPKGRDGMIEALRVLKACRKTAVAARRAALQMIHNTIVCAPEELRGGDRAANSALHIIAIGRLRTDERTKAYVARRIAEGHSKLEAIRGHDLKRARIYA
jgi:transposase